jgi:energy-converting hydrogenase Eha subunit H
VKRWRNFWLFVIIIILTALIYLWEHRVMVELTFKLYEKKKELKKRREKVERLRIKLTKLTLAKRFYEE